MRVAQLSEHGATGARVFYYKTTAPGLLVTGFHLSLHCITVTAQ